MRLLFIFLTISWVFGVSVTLPHIVVKAKKETKKLKPKWAFVENVDANNFTNPGFEEQNFKNIPGLNTVTTGNPGQLTTISILGASSSYTKILWAGIAVNETDMDAAIIPFSTGKVEVKKGIHCAEYGNGAIGGVVNVIPFSMPENQNGGINLNAGNTLRNSHLWWKKHADGFSIQQHFESDYFHGKNTIPKRYQDIYPTSKSPKTEKNYFLNQVGFESHHGKAALQIGLLKSCSTGNDISMVSPYDSRSKRTFQIYALDVEGTPESIQPYCKILNTKILNRDFSPYINNESAYGSTNTKAKFGIKIKKENVILEPVGEFHHSQLNSSVNKLKKNDQFAFVQGIHFDRDTLQWKNWARIQKANHLESAYAFSSSVLKIYGDTEFSAHIGTGFFLPTLYMLNDIKHGNTSLKNETAIGGNLGIAQRTTLGTFNAVVFRTDYKDKISYQNGKYINLYKSSQKGFECGWKNQFGAWGIHLATTYVESFMFKPKQRLLNIPRFSSLATISYKEDKIFSSIGVRHIGSQIQPDFVNSTLRIKQGGYILFFANYKYKFTENATWKVGIENVLARQVETPPGYRNPGFQIQTGVSITW